MKTVLVPTDFSECSTVGVNIAAVIAAKTRCSIVLHHNVSSLINWEALSESERMDKHPAMLGKTVKAKRKLNDIMSRELDGFPTSKLITHGITSEEIVSKAKQLPAEMIIMGAHGNVDSVRYFIGSNIQKVIREATMPVLAAKHAFPKREIKKILFPFSFDEDVQKPFGEVLKFAAALGATIYLLYVDHSDTFKDPHTKENEMNAFIERYPNQEFVTSVYHHLDPVSGILEYYKEIEADMIGTITHDRKHSAKYLIGITELLVFHADIPVLSVNAWPFERAII